MRGVLAACALLAVFASHVAHAGNGAERAPEPGMRLEILATAQIPAQVEGVGRVGGLSGLITAGWLGASHADFLAVSDSPDKPMLFRLRVELTRRAEDGGAAGGVYSLSVRVSDPVEITCDAADAESLAGVRPTRTSPPNPALLIGFESPARVAGFRARGLMEGARSIQCAGGLPIPERVAADVHQNRAFESIAWVGEGTDWGSPLGEDRLWVATEAALTSDGEQATPERGTLCRVMIFDSTLTRLEREVFYETEPAPAPGLPGTPTINSLAEMVGLPGGRVLVLERSFALPRGYNVTLFVLDGTTEEREGLALPALSKRRVADLRGLGLVLMGNLEGMALGPPLAAITGDAREAGRLLLMVADDNFGRDGQVGSQVVALRLVDGS